MCWGLSSRQKALILCVEFQGFHHCLFAYLFCLRTPDNRPHRLARGESQDIVVFRSGDSNSHPHLHAPNGLQKFLSHTSAKPRACRYGSTQNTRNVSIHFMIAMSMRTLNRVVLIDTTNFREEKHRVGTWLGQFRNTRSKNIVVHTARTVRHHIIFVHNRDSASAVTEMNRSTDLITFTPIA